MKKSKLFYLMGIAVMAAALTFSSCKKDDEEPTPTPTPSAYTPAFSPTYLVIDQGGGVELLDFYITCVTDDWEMIKCIVTYPGGLGNDEFIGSGAIVTQGTPFTFSQYFVKLGGTWTFAITGNIKSGTHVGESFTVVTSVNVSGK